MGSSKLNPVMFTTGCSGKPEDDSRVREDEEEMLLEQGLMGEEQPFTSRTLMSWNGVVYQENLLGNMRFISFKHSLLVETNRFKG